MDIIFLGVLDNAESTEHQHSSGNPGKEDDNSADDDRTSEGEDRAENGPSPQSDSGANGRNQRQQLSRKFNQRRGNSDFSPLDLDRYLLKLSNYIMEI